MKSWNKAAIAFCAAAIAGVVAGPGSAADGTSRAEKAEAICTGAAGDDEYRRWEIDPSTSMCPANETRGLCTIRQKNDPSVTYDHQCQDYTDMDDNEAAAPITVDGGGRSGPAPTKEE